MGEVGQAVCVEVLHVGMVERLLTEGEVPECPRQVAVVPLGVKPEIEDKGAHGPRAESGLGRADKTRGNEGEAVDRAPFAPR